MKDVISLIDAVCDVYDRMDFHPNPDGSTHCNQAVQSICAVYGYGQMQGMTADQMVAFLDASDDWSCVPMVKAQEMANAGSLLIAGLESKALNQQHGHVVVIRPGREIFSGKWRSTPRCVNIGAHDFIARAQFGTLTNQPVGINDAFIPPPTIWVLRSSL